MYFTTFSPLLSSLYFTYFFHIYTEKLTKQNSFHNDFLLVGKVLKEKLFYPVSLYMFCIDSGSEAKVKEKPGIVSHQNYKIISNRKEIHFLKTKDKPSLLSQQNRRTPWSLINVTHFKNVPTDLLRSLRVSEKKNHQQCPKFSCQMTAAPTNNNKSQPNSQPAN